MATYFVLSLRLLFPVIRGHCFLLDSFEFSPGFSHLHCLAVESLSCSHTSYMIPSFGSLLPASHPTSPCTPCLILNVAFAFLPVFCILPALAVGPTELLSLCGKYPQSSKHRYPLLHFLAVSPSCLDECNASSIDVCPPGHTTSPNRSLSYCCVHITALCQPNEHPPQNSASY